MAHHEDLLRHGFNDFIICCGYKGYVIKEYFANYFLHAPSHHRHPERQRVEIIATRSEPWRITLVDTGADTMTGGRLKRACPIVEGRRDLLLTYGDGVANIDIPPARLPPSHGRLAPSPPFSPRAASAR